MADNPTVESTTENSALIPKKGALNSFFDFFGGKALRLNNDLGAMAIFFFRSFFMIFRIKQIPEIIAPAVLEQVVDWMNKVNNY